MVAEPTVATTTGAESLSGLYSLCALGPMGARCWGYDPSAIMFPMVDHPIPVEVLPGATILAPGLHFYCVLDADQRARCRGWNNRGQCGATPSSDPVPWTVVPEADGLVDLRAGADFVCGLRASGRLACWGSNLFGALGHGVGEDQSVAHDVMGLDDVTQFDVSNNVCARRADGTAWCWGSRWNGQLGEGYRVNDRDSQDLVRATPLRVPGIDRVIEVAVGRAIACALRDDQSVWCWGYNMTGGLPWPAGTVSPPVQIIAPL